MVGSCHITSTSRALRSKGHVITIRLSANTKSDKFLKEVVAPNILTLCKSKEVITQKTRAIFHSLDHLVVDNFKNVLVIIKLLLIEDIFLEKPSCRSGNDGESRSLDLFIIEYFTLANKILFYQYRRLAKSNWRATAVTRKDGNILFLDDINNILGYNAGAFFESDDNV